MSDLVKLCARPKLNSPNMIAAWPGIANVPLLVATYLDKKLGFKPLGEIEASHFFDPIGVMVRDNVVEAPEFPQSKFSYWKNKSGGSDLILFIGDDQPAAKGYELANTVIDVALKFQVKRIYTLAAAKTRMHHTEQPKVWGVATIPELNHISSFGDSFAEAEANVREAALGYLEVLERKQKRFPKPAFHTEGTYLKLYL